MAKRVTRAKAIVKAKNRPKPRPKVPKRRLPAEPTAYIRYVYFDIVAFSLKSIEDQVSVVGALNRITLDVLRRSDLKTQERFLLPAGDGICIGVLGDVHPDTHIRIAVDLLQQVAAHNLQEKALGRRFHLRIGINSGTDNIIQDVNGRRNVAGSAINMTQRIMSMADEDQILVSETVFRELEQRDGYDKSFREYNATAKHGIRRKVYQFVEERDFISKKEPSRIGTPNVDLVDKIVREGAIEALSPVQLGDLERAILNAAVKGPDDEGKRSFVESFVRALELPAVWRSEYRIKAEMHKVEGSKDLRKLRMSFTWTFVNRSGVGQTITQHIVQSSRTLNTGEYRDQWFRLCEARLGDDNLLDDMQADRGLSADNELYYRGRVQVTIPRSEPLHSGVEFHYVTETLQELFEPWLMTFALPVHNVSFEIKCPVGVTPKLYAIGMPSDDQSTDPVPLRKMGGTFSGTFKGWLLRSHGLFLVFREP